MNMNPYIWLTHHLHITGYREEGSPATTPQLSETFDNPERELFLWAVLLNRQELAEFFWNKGKDHIGRYLSGKGTQV